jgi:nucleoside-diphosphate-sugar epimerase
MTRTLVTGAAGFTGRYVSAELSGRGHEVHALVHEDLDEELPGVQAVHHGNLTSLHDLHRVVRAVRPDHVIHLAAIAFVAHGDVEQMYLTNVVGTRQLLEALSQLPQSPKSVVLASSANVYGNGREGQLDENVPPAPSNDYGVSKWATEQVASLYSRKLALIVVRPFNYTGRGQSADFLVPKIIAHAKDRAPFIELGNTNVARDFSDVRCVAEIYARLLDASQAIGSTFNICSGHAVSLQQVVDLVSQLSGHRLQVRVNRALVRAEEVRKLWGSAARLTSLIGPLPAKPLEETLLWMLEA